MQRIVSQAVKNLAGVLATGALLAGCAWDNSPPPFHTVIRYDPSRAQTFLASVPPTNAPSTRDWKTNQVVGVDYGNSASSAPPANTGGAEGVGAASSPSGISTGGGAGTATTATGIGTGPGTSAPAGTAAPGSIISSPPGTGIIGTTPSAAPASTSSNPSARSSPSVGTGPAPVTRLGTGTLPNNPGVNTFGGIGVTNTGSSVTPPNTLTGQTNFLPYFSRPTP